jgi:ferric-dicitrate binding protein FerR (iron transport regulator)
MRSTHGLAARTAIVIGFFGLAACATTSVSLDRVLRQEPSGYVAVASNETAGIVTVFRGGKPLSARPPLPLQTGDEIETRPGGAALIQLANGGMVVVDAGSRVRIGSLEVLFGRVFAAVRGLFSVESENVVAGVEGTEFLFEAGTDKSVHVVVLEGEVTCTSKAARWPPTRLRMGQGFSVRPGGTPIVHPANPGELNDIRGWARRVVNPTRPK